MEPLRMGSSSQPDQGKINSIRLATEEKEKISLDAIRDALVKKDNPYISFSGGKRSLVLLDMARRISSQKLNVLYVDTGVEFNAILEYMEKMRKLWRFELKRLPSEGMLPSLDNKAECCKRLIHERLGEAISEYRINSLLIGSACGDERWADSIFFSKNYNCATVHPISHFTDDDIWTYIKWHNLPYCSLYNQGYEKIDCEPCSGCSTASNKSTMEEALIKERLKKLGYL